MATILDAIFNSPLAILYLVFYLSLIYWIFADAKARGSDSAVTWALGCLLIPPAIILYLIYRSEIGGRTAKASQSERAVGTYVIAYLVALLLRPLLQMMGLMPHFIVNPLVELPYDLLLLLLGGIPGYLLVWKNGWARFRRRFNITHESERVSS